jgi:hypothetical protein
LWPYTTYPYYYGCYPYSGSAAAAAAAAAATAAAVSSDMAVCRTIARKNAEICDLRYNYERELDELENQLNGSRIENNQLRNEFVLFLNYRLPLEYPN